MNTIKRQDYYTRNKEKIKAKSRAYYQAHKEQQKQTRKSWLSKNPNYDKLRHDKNKEKEREQHSKLLSTIEGKYSSWKSGAKTREIEWNLTLEDVMDLPLVCGYTGVSMTLNTNKPNTASIDRIDSSNGYTKDNIVLCCATINLMKNKLGKKEFLDWCKLVVVFN